MSNLPELPAPFFWRDINKGRRAYAEREEAVLCATGTEWCKRHHTPDEALAIVFNGMGEIYVRVWRKSDWRTLPERFPTVEAAANYAWAMVGMGEVDYKLLGENHESA